MIPSNRSTSHAMRATKLRATTNLVVEPQCGEADGSDLATQLIGLGFANVKVLRDPAIGGWKKAGYPLE